MGTRCTNRKYCDHADRSFCTPSAICYNDKPINKQPLSEIKEQFIIEEANNMLSDVNINKDPNQNIKIGLVGEN